MSAPAMQFWVGDYMRDTLHLNTTQHGAYLLILLTMHSAGGSLPYDDAKLARITRLSKAQWLKHKTEILAFFEIDGDLIKAEILNSWQIKENKRASISIKLRKIILERDDYTCVYCGETDEPLEVDHVHPYSLGGPNTEENLVCSCRSCNRSKGAKMISEWRVN